MATVMRKMNVISRCEALYRMQHMQEHLPGIYHSYILAICGMPGSSQDKLVKHLCVNKSSVTRHLVYLEKNGYVERRQGKDKREILVYPTQKMLDVYGEVAEITKRWNALLSDGISEEEMVLFHSILDRMFEKSRELAAPGETAE